MSSGYYHHGKRDERLPPLKEVLGDMIDKPLRPAYAPQTSRSSRPQPPETYSRHSSTHDVTNDPYHHSHSSHNASYGSQTQRTHSSHHSHPSPRAEAQSPGYQYSLYGTNSGQLTHKGSSTRDAFPSKSASNTRDPSKKYVCETCGVRFDRPGGLEIHTRSHTGEKPYSCPVQGCGRSFPTQSNMRRHERTHFAESAFEPADDDSATRGRSRQSTSSHTSSFPAKYYQSGH